ncbi:MAG: cupin domain-containing protein [Proteobacteria bacterium]|nr:cupin domain-containing protein [Pseudomonadota bacterium]
MNQAGTRPWETEYTIEATEIIAETPALRVLRITLAVGQFIPWHYHSAIVDQFFCLEGDVNVETRAPKAVHALVVGGECTVPPRIAHRVSNQGPLPCRFVLVQGVGPYDYCALPDAR